MVSDQTRWRIHNKISDEVFKESMKIKPRFVVNEIKEKQGHFGLQYFIEHLLIMFLRKIENREWSAELELELNNFIDEKFEYNFK